MGSRLAKVTKSGTTPVTIVQANNPEIKNIAAYSRKWAKRWPHIENPWPPAGTFDPEVVKTLQVLITAHKANQKAGKQGLERSQRRKLELKILDLFFKEGQRLTQAYKERLHSETRSGSNTGKQMQANLCDTPFSHVAPPPYVKPNAVPSSSKSVYPQLPVLSTTGRYDVVDGSDQVIETGTADAKIILEPDCKKKKGKSCDPESSSHRTLKLSSTDTTTDGKGKSSKTSSLGGYSSHIKKILARAEQKGKKSQQPINIDTDTTDDETSSESDSGSDDDDDGQSGQHLKAFTRFGSALERLRSSRMWLNKELDAVDRTDKEQVNKLQDKLDAISLEEAELTIEMDEESRRLKKSSVKRGQKKSKAKGGTKVHNTRGRSKRNEEGDESPHHFQGPVIVRGQTMDYKPWAATDMTDLVNQLPPLLEGAFPWISKLEQLTVGTQLAMADIKSLLALVVGVPAMDAVLERAGLRQYIDTKRNDGDLFVQHAALIWRALRDIYPTNIHPDAVIIEPLKEGEAPRAYVARALQKWRDKTGSDSTRSLMETALVRTKIEQGLPEPVRKKLIEVVGLGNMTSAIYIDNVAHYVDLHRKKELQQKMADQETLRKLTTAQLAPQKDNKQAAVIPDGAPQQQNFRPQPQATESPPACPQEQDVCYRCGIPGHYYRECRRGGKNPRWAGSRGPRRFSRPNSPRPPRQGYQQPRPTGPVNPYRGPPVGGLY